jgi:hypothetical protein
MMVRGVCMIWYGMVWYGKILYAIERNGIMIHHNSSKKLTYSVKKTQWLLRKIRVLPVTRLWRELCFA